jgi:hypothetical protein
MKTTYTILALVLASACMGGAIAQDKGPAQKADAGTGHEPPPQAYTDCVGKKAGETVQHTTREGTVEATCEESPKGLVARPKQPGGPAVNSPAK